MTDTTHQQVGEQLLVGNEPKESKLKKFAAKQALLSVVSGAAAPPPPQQQQQTRDAGAGAAAEGGGEIVMFDPFARPKRARPYGSWDFVTVSPSGEKPRCEIGGVASASLIGVVVSATRGQMRTQIHSRIKPQAAWQLQLACRTYQADRVGGRVSMFKHIVTARVRAGTATVEQQQHFAKGDVVFVRGQVQLHAVFDPAAKKSNCRSMCIDVAPGCGEIVHLSSPAAAPAEAVDVLSN
jgi:hypothetical protein